jgi:subtilisin family serine protease
VNRRNTLPLALIVFVAACTDATSPSASRLAPFLQPEPSLERRIVENEYIVVLRDDADVGAGANRARGRGAEVVAEWQDALRGFAVRGNPELIISLRTDPDVQYVEQVQEFSIQTTQSPATWGLDRIDQRDRPLSNSFTYTRTGAGVRAYIIDTGIRTTHNEFGGRASIGANYASGGGEDCNGHGTHVAGTVGGTNYGVAKGVTLVGVRVLNCAGSGTTTGVINGVNWVKSNAIKPAVANMSLGGGVSTTLDNAVASAISSGITFAVAAGNSGANACNYSPARTGTAITVGATTSSDARASYSNFGSCVDIFAPGSGITSAWKNSNTATNTISGTSMASPHVAGVVALYLQANPGASPASVANALIANASLNKISSVGTGSPNRLLFTDY